LNLKKKKNETDLYHREENMKKIQIGKKSILRPEKKGRDSHEVKGEQEVFLRIGMGDVRKKT